MKKSAVNGRYITLFVLVAIAAVIFLFTMHTDSRRDLKSEINVVENSSINKALAVSSRESSISIAPKVILPGDPVLITVNSAAPPVEILWDKKNIPIFSYDGKSRGLTGIDFNEKVLEHQVNVRFANGETIATPVIITPREKIEKPLGIPKKLGGNTKEASKSLVTNLARENAELNSIGTELSPTWTEKFLAPLSNPVITDSYGYDRKTVDRTIVHKGTDFRAPVGTEVKAMNRGIVRIARTYIVYGNAIILDHGLGLNTSYMHLSKMNVKEGDIVEAGQVIGLSGNTGYVDAAHLHISVKINKISVDPMTFLGFFD